jgi:phosphate-selective porin
MVYDGYVGYEADPLLRIQAGQFNTPFTMENVTSSRWLDAMERSLTVRTLGAPYNKDLGVMLWGNAPSGLFDYQLGVFGGDGMNRPSVDNRVDVMGRALVRPLASREDALGKLHLGGSFRYGRRDPDYVFYDAPAMTTPGGYAYWTPVYGKGATETHVVPANQQFAAAAELYVPLEKFDLKSEVVYVREGRREAFVNALWDNERYGTLSGVGGYAQVSFWLMGSPRVNGHPGTFPVIKAPKVAGAPSPSGLQLALRGEILRLKYDSNSGTPELEAGFLDKETNKITVNAYQAALTYWATKHVRLTAEYSLYQFPGSPNSSVSRVGEFPDPGKPATNQATAPGARANAFDFGANHFHEFGIRVGLAL